MARKKKWQYLETRVFYLEAMSRNELFELAKAHGLEPERRVKTPTLRAALLDFLNNTEKIEKEVEDIVENYETIEDIEKKKTATKTTLLPRKLDI